MPIDTAETLEQALADANTLLGATATQVVRFTRPLVSSRQPHAAQPVAIGPSPTRPPLGAKSRQLRAVMSLTRRWQRQGRPHTARSSLVGV